ncbi:MAG: radical SAM protein [Proteobacteria bacterium]|nr:radical SAM protein [Pseudomonadota bacterium]
MNSRVDPTGKIHVALVGPMQQENMPLGYLGAALEASGHRAEIVRFDSGEDHERCLSEIIDKQPDVVGLGISFQYSISSYLELARALRSLGYKGHITCGGHVPTFCYAELLAESPAIDTVVRHEGEHTLVELADTLAAGEELRDISGLVWRVSGCVQVGETRPPVLNLDTLPRPLRPKIALRVGGVPVAFVITSRGCVGDCAYCSIRAFNKDMNGPRFRLREPHAVADEIADLYHKRDVRIFFVQDDLFVLPSEKKTVARMEAIDEELGVRGVGRRLFWIKGRPETITADVLRVMREIGGIHMFLGIENAVDERLRYLGRTHVNEDNRRAIALCREYRIRPSFNFMLFDPDCTLDQVSATIDFAAENLDMPWNLCRTEIYSGTCLHDRLQRKGRLMGDWQTYGYRMGDSRAEVMFRIMRVAFHDRSFAFDSLLNELISLSFARQIHEEFFPGRNSDELNQKVETLIIDVHQNTVDELRRLSDFVATVDLENDEGIRDRAVVSAMELNRRDLNWRETCARLLHRYNIRGQVLFEAMKQRSVAH